MMRPKGMQHVRSMQSVANRSRPATRAQLVAQMARLEHEQARLARELAVWTQKVQQTQEKQALLAAQTAALQAALVRLDEAQNRETASSVSTTSSMITLEY